jgi:hypothetical protein
MALNSAELALRFSAYQTGSNDFGGPDFRPVVDEILQFTAGTAANQADILYVDERAFASSVADTIDLYGVLTNAFGTVISAAEIVGLVIINSSKAGVRNTVTLSVGAGSAPWFGMFGATGDVIKVPPGGVFALFAPDASGLGAVTATTADILTVTPGAAAGLYQIAILARSA